MMNRMFFIHLADNFLKWLRVKWRSLQLLTCSLHLFIFKCFVFGQKSTDRDSAIRDSIKRLRSEIATLVEVDFELLPTMRSMKILTDTQRECILQTNQSINEKILKLLDEVIKSEHSPDKFLKALRQTRQSHVARFIKEGGKIPDGEAIPSDWPLRQTGLYGLGIDRHWKTLRNLLDTRTGLLDEMLSEDCISYEQKEHIEAAREMAPMNERLLEILQRRSVSDYYRFLECLRRTKSYQLVGLLCPDELVNDAPEYQPLNEDIRERLLVKRVILKSQIDAVSSGLVDLMSAHQCITEGQRRFINNGDGNDQRVDRLLDVLRRSSQGTFDLFMECLHETTQGHICDVIGDPFPVVHLTIKTSYRREEERRIMERSALAINSLTPDNRRKMVELLEMLAGKKTAVEVRHLCSQVQQRLEEMEELGLSIEAVDDGGSCRVFLRFTTLHGSQYIFEQFSTTEFQSDLATLFSIVLGKQEVQELLSIKMNVDEYIGAARTVCRLTNLPVFEQIYRITELYDKMKYNHVTRRHFPFQERLPFELLEMLVIKVAGYLFVKLKTVTPLAAVYTVATLCAVCRDWRRALTRRKFIKRHLKSYFRKVCRPYRTSPKNVGRISFESGKTIWGLACWNDELVVAYKDCKTVDIFTTNSPYHLQRQVTIEGLTSPTDIAVSRTFNGLLYVADTTCRIWKVNLSSCIAEGDDEFKGQLFVDLSYRPHRLSATTSRGHVGGLVVTPRDGLSVLVYDETTAQLTRQVRLPVGWCARHVHDLSYDDNNDDQGGTRTEVYVIAHYNNSNSDEECCQLAVVNAEGELIGSLDEGIVERLDDPYYVINVAADNSESQLSQKARSHKEDSKDICSQLLIVADTYNMRIVLVRVRHHSGLRLQLDRILLREMESQPYRMTLCERSGLLFVAYLHSKYVDVYMLKK